MDPGENHGETPRDLEISCSCGCVSNPKYEVFHSDSNHIKIFHKHDFAATCSVNVCLWLRLCRPPKISFQRFEL